MFGFYILLLLLFFFFVILIYVVKNGKKQNKTKNTEVFNMCLTQPDWLSVKFLCGGVASKIAGGY